MNLVSSTTKAQAYRATRPVKTVRGGVVSQDLTKMYVYRDALVEALAIQAVCSKQKFEVVTVDEAIAMFEANKCSFTTFTFLKVSDLTTRSITTKKWNGYKPAKPVAGKAPRMANPSQYSVLDTHLARGMSATDLESGKAMRSFNKNTLVSMKHSGVLYLIA